MAFHYDIGPAGHNGIPTVVGGTDFLTREPSRATWIVPAGLIGPQTLKIIVWMNGGYRTTIWPDPITPGP